MIEVTLKKIDNKKDPIILLSPNLVKNFNLEQEKEISINQWEKLLHSVAKT